MGSARAPLYPPPAWPSPAYSYSTHREASPNVPKDCGDPHAVLAPGLNELEDGKVKVTHPPIPWEVSQECHSWGGSGWPSERQPKCEARRRRGPRSR